MINNSPNSSSSADLDTCAAIRKAAVHEIARELGYSPRTTAFSQASLDTFDGDTLSTDDLASSLYRLKLQVSSMSAAQVRRWVRPGNIAIGVSNDQLVILSSGSWNRVRETFIDATAVSRRWLSPKRLSQEINASPREWLAVSQPKDLDDMANAKAPLAPWQRLRAFITIERRDISVVAVYAATLGLLSLLIPVATQSLVNTIAFGAILQPIVVLTLALFFGLAIAGGLAILQAYLVEVFQRRIIVRFSEDLGARIPQVSHRARDSQDLVELNNRFLDVITIQKSAAELLLVGLGLVLQTSVGLVLLGFYHPALLAYSLLLLVTLVIVAQLGRGGTKSAVIESKAKFAIVAWLDELARTPQLFSGGQGKILAAERMAERVHTYVNARRTHYRHVFAVLVGGVAIQVIAFVALLGIGGYLVIERQLTLGQLVAAEIVAGAITIRISKLGSLADKTFDLVAATDKLGLLLDLPLREDGTDDLATSSEGLESSEGLDLVAENLAVESSHQRTPPCSFHVQPGEKICLGDLHDVCKSLILQAIAGQRDPAAGSLYWDGRSRPSIDSLMDSVFLASDDSLISGTVIDNLRLGNVLLSEAQAWEILKRVDLSATIDQLGGLSCQIRNTGTPLSTSERRRLVLARALVTSPRLLLIDETLDITPSDPALIELFLGGDAPWSAIVASHHPQVKAALSRTIDSGDKGAIS